MFIFGTTTTAEFFRDLEEELLRLYGFLMADDIIAKEPSVLLTLGAEPFTLVQSELGKISALQFSQYKR
jgi:hypothetical protein